MTNVTENLRSPGRPQEESSVREDLILHARALFIAHPYEKVSTRMVANAAGVNMGMIRYYFNNKAGLFETMLRDTLSPFHEEMTEISERSTKDLLLVFMTNFFKVMAKHTNFPRFISRTMQLPPDMIQRQIVERIMLERLPLMKEILTKEIGSEGVMKDGVQVNYVYFTMLNLMIFPFVAPPEILRLHNINIDDDFLSGLLEHNTRLITQGIINTDER